MNTLLKFIKGVFYLGLATTGVALFLLLSSVISVLLSLGGVVIIIVLIAYTINEWVDYGDKPPS